MERLPFALPPMDALLLRRRAEALAALQRAGWRPWAIPLHLDAERRRRLNLDLFEPEVAWHGPEGVAAVLHLEADRAGLVTLVELTTAEPVAPDALADELMPGAGAPHVRGGAEAREWVWGPESGGAGDVGGEPVRLWTCVEPSQADRLWAILTVVRHG